MFAKRPESRHGKGPPGYGPGPDLGPFFTNLDRTAVLFLGLERTWKVPDFLQIDRPVLFKLLKEDFQSISKKNSNFHGLFLHFSDFKPISKLERKQ